MKFQDLSGLKFNSLTVVNRAWTGTTKTMWLCICVCGSKTFVASEHLKSGRVKSCGCYRKEINSTHKMTASKTYNAWDSMLQRCSNPLNISYRNYGARGVTVCDRWKTFENFLADMGEKPIGDYQLDRIDNNGPYSSDNCRWVTRKNNNRNKRTNHIITYNGKTQCLTDWAIETSIPMYTIYSRLKRLGWSVEKSLTVIPTKRITTQGESA